MKKSNYIFVISVFVIIVGLLVALAFINKHQKTVETNVNISAFKLDKQPLLGDEKAPVSIVEFGDFKCPYCKNWEESVFPQVYKDYIETGKAKIYFINYPFLGPDSTLAANAGEAIYHQNVEKFWEFYDKLYNAQQDESKVWATNDFLIDFVKKNITGIDYNKFESDVKNSAYAKDVSEDLTIGNNVGVQGTPSVYVSGKAVQLDYDSVKTAIDESLKGVK